jgi:predicted Zn finger-like uncharacterized protein
MFTVCPKCALTLVVTAADLRVAQGYVRCGRCSNVFNAIVGLSDDRQAKAAKAAAQAAENARRQAPAAAPPPPPPPPPPKPAPAPPPPAPKAPPKAAPKPEPPVDDTAITGENEAIYAEPEPMDVVPDTALEFDATSTDVSKVFVEPPAQGKGDPTGTFETIVLSDDDVTPDEVDDDVEEPPAPPEEDEYVDNDLRSLAARIDAEAAASPKPARQSAGPAPRASAPPRFVSESEREPAPAVARTAVPETFSEPPPEVVPPHPALKFVWPGAAALALLLLAAQAIHHYRHDLATDPRFNRTLTSLYAKLGLPLVPRWDLTAYEVRQLGASSSAGTRGQLLVRASLKNSATHPLPLPPRGYAPGAVPEGAVLGAGQRLDAEMTFVDPGQQAVGFEIDACLPGPDNAIHCANDAAATR